jgi:hypothetical protein
MAKQIIILDVSTGPGGDLNVHWLFWLTVALAAQVPISGATSLWRSAAAGDITNLQTGAVIEESHAAQWPAATTKATIQAAILALGTARQTQITNAQNPNLFYGGFWDSVTGWSF